MEKSAIIFEKNRDYIYHLQDDIYEVKILTKRDDIESVEFLYNDKYFNKLFGTSTANGILLIANSLLIGILLYYAAKYMMSNFTYEKIENPFQFIFKCIIF